MATPPEPDVDRFLLWLEESPDDARRWLRWPGHRIRCSCGEYGIPFDGWAWYDGGTTHFLEGTRWCQPFGEVIW